jgi:hypothetical protein
MTDLPPPPPPENTPPPAPPAPPVAPPTPPVAPPPTPTPPAPPTPYAVGAPNPNNGMAVAALVLGILTFVCLGPIAGVLAIIFGFLGMKKANELGGTGKGMAVAGLILGAVGTILSIILFVVFVVLAGTATVAINDATGPADPSTYSYKITDCGKDSFDDPEMTVTVTNKTDSKKQFTFDYEFRSSSGAIIDSGSTFIPETIPANDSLEVQISSFESTTSSSVKCEITGVNNWFN